MKMAVWLSYDLGITGDFTGLYQWLDTHHAIECGNSAAFIKFDYEEDFFTEIKSNMGEFVKVKSTDRIYVIYKDVENNRTIGKFLFGNRKTAPWAGYALSNEIIEDTL